MAINFDHQRDRISTSSRVLTVNTTGALTVPVGTIAQRPTNSTGQIRFNTELQTFEGYNGVAWSTLGGVIDTDRNTYIIAETSPGANNNDLDFYTDGVQRLQIDETGDLLFGSLLNKFTVDFNTGDTTIAGDLTVSGDVTIGGNIQIGDVDTDSINVVADFSSNLIPDIDATYNLGSNAKNWNTAFVQRLDSNTDVILVDITGALTLPVGSTAERPTAATGMIRFNTDDQRFEAYDGTAWTGVGGVIDVDQNTYIIAETSPGANNNDLDFYTDGVHRLQIDEFGDFLFGDGLNKFTIDFATGNTTIAGTLDVDSITLNNLTENRIVIVGASGLLEDDANFTFDGTTFNIGATGEFTVNEVSGDTQIKGIINVDGQATLASVNVEDLTENRIVIVGATGELEDSADLTFDGSELNIGTGLFTVDVLTGDVFAGGDMTVDGNLTVNGTTTTVNSNTVTIDDPIFTLGGDNDPAVDDAKDRGIEFKWHDGIGPKTGFFGFDNTNSKFTFIPDATNTGEIFSGTPGDVVFGDGLFVDGTFTNISVTTQATLASAAISDLTDNRIVIAGTIGELEDSANLTFDGTTFAIGVTNFTVAQSTGNTSIAGTLDVDGQTTVASINVEDLTATRLVYAGTNGELQDSANLTFDGSTIAATATFNLTGAQTITSTLDVDGQTTLASVNIEDLTNERIVLVGATGELQDSADVTFDGTTFDLGQGNFTVTVASGDVFANGDVTVNGDLTVNGTLTTINSTTVTIDDPVFTLGGDQTPTVDDNKDRGIEFKWHTGTFDRVGFFGFDDSSGRFTFIPNATNTAEVFSGLVGDAAFGNIDLSSANISSVQIGVSGSTEIDTTTGNLVLDSAAGTVIIDDNASVSGTLGVTGETTLASAIVSDLTDDRIVIAGIAGALEDSANLTFNGTTFNVGNGNFTVDQSTGAVYTAGNAQIIGTLNVDGQSTLASLNVEDLTDNRIVIVGTSGELEDSANLTFDGTTLAATATFNLTGAQTITSTLDVDGQTTLSSANIEDLTENRIVIVGVNGELEDDANFTFNGTTLTLTANQTVTGSVDITGDLDVDNININGNTISSTDLNGNINITPDGTGEVVISSATVSDLTDDRIVVAGTGGTLEDNANFRFDGTQFLIGPAISPTFTVTVATGNTDISGNLVVDGSITSGLLTNDRVVIAGVNGILEDSANFTFDGTTLSVGQGNFTAQVATGNVNVNGTLTVGESAAIGSATGSTSTTTGALTVVGGVGIGENVYIGGNLSVDGTLGADGGVTLGDNISLDILTLNAKISGSLLPSANDTYSIGGTSEAWKDLFLSESITFEGGTSENEIVLPTNQSDALSITETSGDLIVITTTSGARLITMYPNTVIEGTLTVGTSVGTTTIDEILDEDDFISNSDTALATQQSIKAYVDSVEANVELEFQGDTGPEGSVNLRTEVFTIAGTANEIETSSNAQTITIGLPDDVTIGNDLLVTNNFRVNGNTTTIDTPTLIADDRIITIGSVATLTANDGQDRGVEFKWHNGTSAKTGFFGYDNSANTFTFVPDATNTSEVINGTPGNVTFGDGTFFGVIAGNISAGLVDDNTITTSTGNLTIDSTGGTVAINDNLSVTGTATLASAIVSDLTDNRIVIAGSSGLLEDNANFRFDGTNFSIGPSGSESFSVAVSTGNTSISGTLTVQQDVDFGGNVTLGGISTDNVIFNGYVASNIVPDANDTRDLGTSSNAWRDIYLTEAISFQGATSENEIVIPTNLADGLSIRDSAGDLIVITTTTGSQLITITPNVQIDGTFTLDSGVPVSTILDEDDMSSNSDVALATQQSIKAYVDNSVSDVDLNFAGGAGTGTVNLLTQTFTIAGTANEIETTALDQTLTIGLPDSVTITNDLNVGGNTVITGNLTVNGSTTTVSTTELVVEDNIITLNQGEVGAGVTAGSAGIEIDRGSEATVSFVWNEANDRWTAGSEDIEAGEFFGTIDGGTF